MGNARKRQMQALLTAAGIIAAAVSPYTVRAQEAEPVQAHGDAKSGETLYRKYGCYACHGYTGETGFGTRLNPPRFSDPVSFAAYARRPSGQRTRAGAGGRMPSYEGLTDKEFADIYAYLASLPSYSPPVDEIPLLSDIAEKLRK